MDMQNKYAYCGAIYIPA